MPRSNRAAAQPLSCLCSMAVRGLLDELVAIAADRIGRPIGLVPLGGVEVARRVRAGEPADLVVLAGPVVLALEAEGHVVGASTRPVARSLMAAAVPTGASRPDITSKDALRYALAHAGRIAYSTGPSGDHLLALLERWGLHGEAAGRLVRADPGVPVAALLARGDADLGFQQMSELSGAPGIDLLGPLPAEAQHATTFAAGLCARSSAPAEAAALLAFLASEEASRHSRQHGMEPP